VPFTTRHGNYKTEQGKIGSMWQDNHKAKTRQGTTLNLAHPKASFMFFFSVVNIKGKREEWPETTKQRESSITSKTAKQDNKHTQGAAGGGQNTRRWVKNNNTQKKQESNKKYSFIGRKKLACCIKGQRSRSQK
jgi:hypothetical protein